MYRNDIFDSGNFTTNVVVYRGIVNYTNIDENFNLDIIRINGNEILNPTLLAILNSMYQNDQYSQKNTIDENVFNKLNKIVEPNVCSICMENKCNNIKLECKHVFCEDCIKKWLIEKSNTCPNCRTEIKNN